MRHSQIVKKLKLQFPGKKIIFNNEEKPTEILCELEPTSDHPEWSEAVAIIDASIPHVHHKTVEWYEVLDGELLVFLDGKKHLLKKGEVLMISPGIRHYAVGKETWIRVMAKPGWIAEDHILI